VGSHRDPSIAGPNVPFSTIGERARRSFLPLHARRYYPESVGFPMSFQDGCHRSCGLAGSDHDLRPGTAGTPARTWLVPPHSPPPETCPATGGDVRYSWTLSSASVRRRCRPSLSLSDIVIAHHLQSLHHGGMVPGFAAMSYTRIKELLCSRGVRQREAERPRAL